jgi:hypothetical protein
MSINAGKHVLIYDIETIINEKAKAHLASADLGYDSRLKDPAKIEVSRAEKREAAMEKGALYWWYGQIVSISCMDMETGGILLWRGLNELENISKFFNAVRHLSGAKDVLLVGKNNSTFDDGYLIGRCLALDIGTPDFLRRSSIVSDIDQLFAYRSGSASVGKLSEYAFGIGMSKAADGSQVGAMVAAGEWDKLGDYNIQDVKITADIYERYNKDYIYG